MNGTDVKRKASIELHQELRLLKNSAQAVVDQIGKLEVAASGFYKSSKLLNGMDLMKSQRVILDELEKQLLQLRTEINDL